MYHQAAYQHLKTTSENSPLTARFLARVFERGNLRARKSKKANNLVKAAIVMNRFLKTKYFAPRRGLATISYATKDMFFKESRCDDGEPSLDPHPLRKTLKKITEYFDVVDDLVVFCSCYVTFKHSVCRLREETCHIYRILTHIFSSFDLPNTIWESSTSK